MTGVGGPGNGSGVGIVITSKRTTPLAKVPALTFSTTLLEVDGLWFRQVRAACINDMTVLIILKKKVLLFNF